MSAAWIAVLVTAAGCYALKLVGLTVPERLLRDQRLRRFAELVPVALLAALVAVEAGAKGSALVFDPARLAGLVAAVLALVLRAPFLVVILVAAATAAMLRLAGIG
jgi:branched-subunit amino acid transport protein